MKRLLTTGVLALCLLTSQFARAAEDQQAKTKAAMVAKYQLIQEAFENANSEDFEKELTADFKAKTLDKRIINRGQFMAFQRMFLDAVTKVHQVTFRINKVTVTPNRAVVVVTQFYDFDVKDRHGRVHRFKNSSVSRDTWVQISGQWKNNFTETIKSTTTVDGKKVKP